MQLSLGSKPGPGLEARRSMAGPLLDPGSRPLCRNKWREQSEHQPQRRAVEMAEQRLSVPLAPTKTAAT
jgi:hypothetical protein